MGTGILTTACLCFVLSQSPSDVHYTNRRNPEIPVDVADSVRANHREFRLFASTDQGRTWGHAGVITSEKKAFTYYSAGDGVYWFQVAAVDKSGVQNPDDMAIMKGPPDLKLVIDTLKPIVRTFHAQRVGDDIVVTWDVQEDNPDLSPAGMRIEACSKDALIEEWKAIPISAGVKGQTTFNPGHKKPLALRLSVRDRAGNQSYGMAEVAGTVTTAGFVGQGPTAQDAIKVPESPLGGGTKMPPLEDKKPLIPPPPLEDKKPILPPPPKDIPLRGFPDVPPQVKAKADDNVVADSRTPPEPIKPMPIFPPAGGGVQPDHGLDIKPLAHAAPARKPLPALQYVNQHLVKLQYEIKRQGPSGIGGIQVWLTKDDGETWNPYAELKDLGNEMVIGRQERDFEFRDKYDAPFPDGVYGLILVVKNRAGLGREPRPGDAPEMRIEIDTKPPVAQLFKPVADPQNPAQLLLKWSAQDKNLADNPIDLEYSEKREGPWLPIEHNLKNAGRYTNQTVTGDYSWKIPAGTPVQVYLRLRVRDRAGNESVAVTSEPQFVDLVEPEGALIGVVPQPKR